MPESDCLKILLAHDRWATLQIIGVCGTFRPDQFHQRFEMGPGSLHDTIAHIIGAIQTWTQTLAGQAPGRRIDQDGQRRTVAELRLLLNAACDALEVEARRLPLSEMVSRVREGREYHFTRGAVLTHVTTHGMHHRAQCLNMLRHLGVKPLPPSSVNEWTRMGEAQG